MGSLNTRLCVEYTWAALGLAWLITLPFTKPAKTPPRNLFTLLQRLWVVGGFFLVCNSSLHDGWLGRSFLPLHHTVQVIGLLIAVTGCAFAIWARFVLGRNWSAPATIREDHTLITAGPYRVARHPIYTGVLIACLGTTLVYGEWRCAFGSVILAIGLAAKISQEERLLLDAFPDSYPRYRHQVKALLPWIL